MAPWRKPYRTLDGHVCLMPYTDAHWRRFFAAVGQPQLAQDQRFATQAMRTRHIAELLETMSGYVAQKDTAYWLASCEQLEIPAAPVTRMDDLPHDPHLQATGFCREERRSDGGCEISAFVRAHQRQPATHRHAPAPGRAHTGIAARGRLGRRAHCGLAVEGLLNKQHEAETE
jgi:crotonobetainyl-CoA:carnitine CoA-transferase CaiB-like acyl-CoA transferase